MTDISTTHTLLTKQKAFADKARIESNSGKMGIGNYFRNTTDNPIAVEDDEPPSILREESMDEPTLDDIPEAPQSGKKRGRTGDGDDAISLSSDDEAFQTQRGPRAKRNKVKDGNEPPAADGDDKKKLAMSTAYEGFSIYGRILCLIVKRKGVKKAGAGGTTTGSQMLENWVSTQANNENFGNMDDEG